MKVKRIFFLFLSFFFLQSWAASVSPSAAQKKACAWLSKVKGRQVLCEQQPIETATDGKGVPLYHVFNATHGEGFVIVAADESSDILGYSTTGSFNKANPPLREMCTTNYAPPLTVTIV